MARRCALTGKGVLVGNNVSHANNKTKRRFLPNLQDTAVYSEALGEMVRLRLSTQALRTVDRKGGLDAFLNDTPVSKLDTDTARLKRRIEKAQAAKAGKAETSETAAG
ncbi:MAG: 50S ribosomal protein L28 [Rhodovibrionaceae bacterium]|nr:50S ribosomal protein L28 [Rhodovibrionaceae bacterium]